MDWGFIFLWLAVKSSGKALLIKDGSGAVARDGFVGRLLAAVPEQKIEFHGCHIMSGSDSRIFQQLHRIKGAGPDFDFLCRTGWNQISGIDM